MVEGEWLRVEGEGVPGFELRCVPGTSRENLQKKWLKAPGACRVVNRFRLTASNLNPRFQVLPCVRHFWQTPRFLTSDSRRVFNQWYYNTVWWVCNMLDARCWLLVA